MDTGSIVLLIAQIAILVVTFITAKYVIPADEMKTAEINKLNLELIEKYARFYVSWAAEFYTKDSGSMKMKVVINQLTNICERLGIFSDTEELRAIVQKCYEDFMKDGKLPEVVPIITEDVVNENGDEVAIILDDDVKLVK